MISGLADASVKIVDTSDENGGQIVFTVEDYPHGPLLQRLQCLRLGSSQTRVSDWTGILEDWPYNCDVETELVFVIMRQSVLTFNCFEK